MGRIHRRPLWILAQQRKGRIQLTHEHLAAPLPLSVFALSAAFGLEAPGACRRRPHLPVSQTKSLPKALRNPRLIPTCSRPAFECVGHSKLCQNGTVWVTVCVRPYVGRG